VREKKAPVPIENALEVIRILKGKKSFAEDGAVFSL
jgi:hypothetical protein